jgi:hypothetical protein
MLLPFISRLFVVVYIVGRKIRVEVGRRRQYKPFEGFVRRMIGDIQKSGLGARHSTEHRQDVL